MYQVKKKGKTFKDHTIEKKYEHTITFSIADVEAHQAKLDRLQKEIEAEMMLAKAKMQNIEEHHPFIKTMDDQRQFTVSMYWDAREHHKKCAEKMKEVAKQQADYRSELKAIYKELGFEDGKKKTKAGK